MKKLGTLLIMAILIAVSAANYGCKKEGIVNTGAHGTLRTTNDGQVIETIFINGANRGIITPGESKDFILPVGVYTVELIGSGGVGCSDSTITIKKDQLMEYSCNIRI